MTKIMMAVLLLCMTVQAQVTTDALSMTQCNVNYNSWKPLDMSLKGAGTEIHRGPLPIGDLVHREDVMMSCLRTAYEYMNEARPNGTESNFEFSKKFTEVTAREQLWDKFFLLYECYVSAIRERVIAYTIRHKEFEQVLVEDAAGKR